MSFLHWLFKRVRERALKASFKENQEYGKRLGRLFYYLPIFFERKRIALENISLAFAGALKDKRREILKGLFEHLGMSLLEVISLEKLDASDFHQIFLSPEGLEKLKEGGIVVSAHFGNWELSLAALSYAGFPVNVIVRPPSDPFFAEYIDKIRRRFGTKVIPKGASLKEALRCLERRELLIVVVDQDEGKEGIFLPFMGRMASTPRGAFLLSLKYGVPLIPLFSWREDDGHHKVKVFPPLYPQGKSELDLARIVNFLIEEMVWTYPSQWLWIHRRWKTKPPERGKPS